MSNQETPEKQVGFLNKITFWWFNSFILSSNYQKLEYNDLYENIEENTSNFNYKKYKSSEDENLKVDVWYNILWAYRNRLIISFIFSLVLIFFNFLPSLILNEILKYLTSKNTDLKYGIYLSVSLLLVGIFYTIATQNFTAYMFNFGLKVRNLKFTIGGRYITKRYL